MELHTCVVTFFVLILSHGSLSTPAKPPVHLQKVSTTYLPYAYENNAKQFGFDTGAVEQFAYDYTARIVYAAGKSNLHVLDIGTVESPVTLHHEEFENVEIRDIEFCGDLVFIAFENITNKEYGYIRVYRKYLAATHRMEQVHSILVDGRPDMIKPTSNCRTLTVALEGPAYGNGATFTDPEGGIGLIKLADDHSGTHTYTKLDFKKFNNRWQELVKSGVRFVYRENGNTFAKDVEPEFVDYNEGETVAYVCLQENNAIAEVDLVREEIKQIHPLGYKDWSRHGLDASDKDGKINIRPWPIYGMYQPDSIHVVKVKGKEYLLTSNEGTSKDYSELPGQHSWKEHTRLKHIWSQVNTSSLLYKWASDNGFKDTIADDTNLGRLIVSKVDGKKDGEHNYSAIFTYGARSFSLFDLENMGIVYDSGSDMETKIKELRPEIFNMNPKGPKQAVSTWDKRSDNRGPEPESLAVAQFDDGVVIFVGTERPGCIFIYSIRDNVTDVRFESMWSGISETDGTWNQLYDRKTVADMNIEDLRYVPANKSPNGQPLLIVAGADTGTLSIFRINGMDESWFTPVCPDGQRWTSGTSFQ